MSCPSKWFPVVVFTFCNWIAVSNRSSSTVGDLVDRVQRRLDSSSASGPKRITFFTNQFLDTDEIEALEVVFAGIYEKGVSVPIWFEKPVPIARFGLSQAAGEKQRQY